jgi:hypothetical protein
VDPKLFVTDPDTTFQRVPDPTFKRLRIRFRIRPEFFTLPPELWCLRSLNGILRHNFQRILKFSINLIIVKITQLIPFLMVFINIIIQF